MKGTTRKGLWTESFGEIGAVLKSLQDHGVKLEHLARLRAEPEFAERVADFIVHGADLSALKLARSAMGENFFGPEDWSFHYGVKFSESQLREAAVFPWKADIFGSVCPLCGSLVLDCHFAFFGIESLNGEPLTILKLQELHPRTGQPHFTSYKHESWFLNEGFAAIATMGRRWYLLHMRTIPNSEDKSYDDQKAMLTPEYEVPVAIVETMKNFLALKKEESFKDCSNVGRVSSVGRGNRRVCVDFSSCTISLDDTDGGSPPSMYWHYRFATARQIGNLNS